VFEEECVCVRGYTHAYINVRMSSRIAVPGLVLRVLRLSEQTKLSLEQTVFAAHQFQRSKQRDGLSAAACWCCLCDTYKTALYVTHIKTAALYATRIKTAALYVTRIKTAALYVTRIKLPSM